MGGHVGDVGVLISVPQVETHLEVAEHHPDHRQEVCDQEEQDVVPAVSVESV